MQTLVAFIEFALGFVPFFGLALIATVIVWIATKLFPAFDEWLVRTMDRMNGVDAEYDEKHNTGYASTTFDQYI